MKRVAVVVVLVVLLGLVGLAVSANQTQVWVGGRAFIGNPLAINLGITQEENFYGSVNLPGCGYLYVFYGDPNGGWHLIFPNRKNRNNYKGPGVNNIALSMLHPIGSGQKITVLFSPYQLLSPDFCQNVDPYLSIEDIGPWCNVSQSYLWVGERIMPTRQAITSSQCSTRPVKPVPSPTCYRPQPTQASCCPSPCAIAWWLMLGIIIGH